MKSQVKSTWTEYETELLCRCGEQQQSYRECKSGKNYVNQFWCNSNDMSPFKLNQCEQCQQLDDYAYNDNYYIDQDSSDYSDYSSSYSSSTLDSYEYAYDVSMTQYLVLFILISQNAGNVITNNVHLRLLMSTMPSTVHVKYQQNTDRQIATILVTVLKWTITSMSRQIFHCQVKFSQFQLLKKYF